MDELLEEEFAKFVADYKPGEAEAIPAIKNYFVRPGAREERTMDECHGRLSVRIGDGDGKEQRIFVGDVIEIQLSLRLTISRFSSAAHL